MRLVDYVVSPSIFNHAVSEHQWGISNAFHKIADMGPTPFLDTHRILEDVTHDRECFSAGFKKNPRDTVEIVQVVANLGEESLSRLLGDPEPRDAFLTRDLRFDLTPLREAYQASYGATVPATLILRLTAGDSGELRTLEYRF